MHNILSFSSLSKCLTMNFQFKNKKHKKYFICVPQIVCVIRLDTKTFSLAVTRSQLWKPQAAIFKPIQFEHFNYANTLSQIIDLSN